jgi:hypothetical protein
MTDPETNEDPLATRAMKTNPFPPKPDPDATQALPAGAPPPPPVLPAAPGSASTQALPVTGDLPETRPPSRARLWLFGVLAVAILGGSLAYYFLYPAGEAPAVLRAKEEVPPVLVPYMDKAKEGDSSAMRMLGTMYYNGLNVQQDRKAGIRWYRKAAAAGSVAAKKDLEQLGLSVDDK